MVSQVFPATSSYAPSRSRSELTNSAPLGTFPLPRARQVTSCPRSTAAAAMCPPRKPVPPSNKKFMSLVVHETFSHVTSLNPSTSKLDPDARAGLPHHLPELLIRLTYTLNLTSTQTTSSACSTSQNASSPAAALTRSSHRLPGAQFHGHSLKVCGYALHQPRGCA